MFWDKRSTLRKPGGQTRGVNIVYVGLTQRATDAGIAEPPILNVGDAFRLLPRAAITLGRSDLCEVTLRSDLVSRAHALITIHPGQADRLALFDLRSRTGTWVDGRQAPRHWLGPGSEFILGNAFRFRCQPAAAV